MSKVQFAISAKAARLIGRENITDVEGAITELVKNAYDADASCVFLKYDIPFMFASNEFDMELINQYLSEAEIETFSKYYMLNNNKYVKKTDISEAGIFQVENILFSKNKIYVIDNGIGMSESVIKTSWMHIGTSEKEINYISDKGRVKTGAKGIGRFALDKLSKNSEVYSKSASDKLLSWSINWEQFTNTKLLNSIDANLDYIDGDYLSIIKNILGDDFRLIDEHDWTTGTIILLSPTREEWNTKMFKKINMSLNSINPLGNVDKFDIVIRNKYFPEYNFQYDNFDHSNFDYKVAASFDGVNTLEIKINRNEFDTSLKNINARFDKIDDPISLSLSEFWNREVFKKENYRKEDYNKEITFIYRISEEFKEEDLFGLETVGPFEFTFYFLKRAQSDMEIVKRIKVNIRKELLDKFGGIKIYRDNFKVRPYGEEGVLFDWLELGIRAQKSPSPLSHPGRWRVEPYQNIGYVKISRDKNPNLYDRSNREALVANKEFNLLSQMLEFVIDKFEFDRQYFGREFSQWKKSHEPKDSKRNAYRIANKTKKFGGEEEYSSQEYEDAVKAMVDQTERLEKAMNTFYAFSSSGVMTNTFAHEFNYIAADFGSRSDQLKICLDYVLKDICLDVYNDYNPYKVLETNKAVDNLLESWINIIINCIDDRGEKTCTDVGLSIDEINKVWEALFEKRQINSEVIVIDHNLSAAISPANLQVIINNLNLNSVWFLKEVEDSARKIEYKIHEEENRIIITMINNGPPLDARYKKTPTRIFEIGESSKIDSNLNKQGTGLGLWIVKEVVHKNDGQIFPMDLEKGFGIKIIFNKENNDEQL